VHVISRPQDFNVEDLYVDLHPVLGLRLLLKCEGFNFAGSVKLKAAAAMIADAEAGGVLHPGHTIVESSSGNLGVALSMIAASKGYRFLCVTDVRCGRNARRLMEAMGARVHTVEQPDRDGGYLAARIDYVSALCAADDRYVWLNQYVNPANWAAHHRITGPAIAAHVPELDVLFVGAGTTGTLMGCARYFRESGRPVTIVAVDAVGSVNFGGAPGRRLIPGLGASVPAPMLDPSCVDDVIHVAETDTLRTCRQLAAHGFLFGGSTGTVVAGAAHWLAVHRPGGAAPAVAVAPDLGERYLETIYRDEWAWDAYPDAALDAALVR
jgi:2,3-diaminopropionate biosynthesis protein SbnA